MWYVDKNKVQGAGLKAQGKSFTSRHTSESETKILVLLSRSQSVIVFSFNGYLTRILSGVVPDQNPGF
jgi:hypothetical protein